MLRIRVRLVVLQALLLVLTAASSGGEIGRSEMGSRYRQSYTVPFNGAVPPNRPGNVLNCEFKEQHPIDPVTGYVGVPSRFTTWDPGNNLSFRGIDPARQMMLLSGNGDKEWFGEIAANLPLPVVGGAELTYHLYSRLIPNAIGSGSSPPIDYTDQLIGMVLGVDLRGAPDTSDFWSIQARLARLDDVVEGSMESSPWTAFDGLDVPDATVNCGWPFGFVRARVATVATAGPVYESSIAFDVSPDGIGWIPVSEYRELAVPLRHVALGIRPSGGTDVGAYYDFIRFYEVAGFDQTSGAIQQLGAV